MLCLMLTATNDSINAMQQAVVLLSNMNYNKVHPSIVLVSLQPNAIKLEVSKNNQNNDHSNRVMVHLQYCLH